MSENSTTPTITVVLNPIQGDDEEVLDPSFGRRPPLTLCYPSPTKKARNVSLSLETDLQQSLDKYQGSYPLSLGRNIWTRIFDTKLSRKLATLEFRDPTPTRPFINTKPRLIMKMNQSASTHRLCINGSRVLLQEVEIFHNDEICLFADKYKYRVVTIESGDTELNRGEPSDTDEHINIPETLEAHSSSESSCGRSPSPHNSSQDTQESCMKEELESVSLKRKHESNDSTATDKIQVTSRNHIIDELTCTICMEIIVQCHVANPCGHVFCKTCIDRIPSVQKKRYKSKSCPSCRKEIASLSWMRCIDNIIWNMVLSGEIFGEGLHGEEDLHQFMSRSGRNINDLTEDQRACIFRRCKRQRIDLDSSQEDLQILAMAPGRFPAVSTFPGPLFNLMTSGRTRPNEFLQIDDSAGTVEDPICLDD